MPSLASFRQHSVHTQLWINGRCVAFCLPRSASHGLPGSGRTLTFGPWVSACINSSRMFIGSVELELVDSQVSLLDPPVLASLHHPWRTATCCPLHRSTSSLSGNKRCLATPTPSFSRSSFGCTSAPPRGPFCCLASSAV